MNSPLPSPGEKHFTASVFIVTKEMPKRVLLVHHKKMNLWMQPGGHIEQFENPVEAAVRESKEETGVNIDFLLDEVKVIDDAASILPVPKFFLEEKISPHKDQPEHYHLDLMYVVEVPHQEIMINTVESNDLRWFTKEETLELEMFQNTRVLLEKIFA